jgi:FAD-dependent urate hydroxylase
MKEGCHFPPAAHFGPRSLQELETSFARDLECLTISPFQNWLEPRVHPKWGPVLDVAIVGAGMAGLTTAFALKRLGILNMKVFDRSPDGLEGPWATYARMEVLRSPKDLVGPALSFSNLTFHAWFEAQFGRAAWDKLVRIPRLQWMDYLRWYRKMIDVPIENRTELIDLSGDADTVLLTLQSPWGIERLAARRVILATGRDGLGGAHIPKIFHGIDRRYCSHSSAEIDFDRFRGKTVGVIGAGASAVDNAATALEAGAARVAMMVRRAELPRTNKNIGIRSPGYPLGFYRLSFSQRRSIVQYIADQAVPPPRDSMLRCSRHANFSLILRCVPRGVSIKDNRILLDTTRGLLAFDHLILATGFAVDWKRRQELASLAPHILLWRDRFKPDDRIEYEQADHPFLGQDLEFLEREAGKAPWVSCVHCLTFPGYLSHGPITGDIPHISAGGERVANAIVSVLFAENYEHTWRRLQIWDVPDLLGDEWVPEADLSAFMMDAADGKAEL